MFLSQINIYPIKSLRGISLKEAEFDRKGLKLDRRWMLVDERNCFLTQRQYPKMATIGTKVEDGFLVVFNEDGGLKIPFEPESKRMQLVKVWASEVLAEVYEDSINDWFSFVLGIRCKLVKMPDGAVRKVDPEYAISLNDEVSFADGYPFLLTNEASLADLNSRLDEPIPMNRFRPNLVVSGFEPFAEDVWRRIKIGENIFHIVKPSSRCIITTIDQETGERKNEEPLKTLAKFRSLYGDGRVFFGQNLVADCLKGKEGFLRVGDRVEVLDLVISSPN